MRAVPATAASLTLSSRNSSKSRPTFWTLTSTAAKPPCMLTATVSRHFQECGHDSADRIGDGVVDRVDRVRREVVFPGVAELDHRPGRADHVVGEPAHGALVGR